ncbi:beta-lactamase family protein [Streptomyces sp. NBC_01275]|nr:beta-lactamase family protein [Streptomyces sp. NBC_01275]
MFTTPARCAPHTFSASSRSPDCGLRRPAEACPHAGGGRRWRLSLPGNTNYTEWAAGGMVSTAQDWARFDTALMSGKLLPPAQLKETKTTVAEESGNPNRHGLGLEKKVVPPCGTVWGHDGQVPGYSSWAYTDSTGRRTVSVFATTVFGIADPKSGAADQDLLNAAICTMPDKPIPTAPASVPTGS